MNKKELECCSICNQPTSELKKIYDYIVCNKCYFSLFSKRLIAFWIDMLFLTTILGQAFPVTKSVVNGQVEYSFEFSITFITLLDVTTILGLIGIALFLIKDGFSGYSLGKFFMGLRTIDDRSGKPINFIQSAIRNAILLIPFAPIFLAFFLWKGYRIGDQWAHSKVIIKKYKHQEIFQAQANPITND